MKITTTYKKSTLPQTVRVNDNVPRSMKILAIDPGYDRLGVAVVEKVDGKELVRFSTCLTSERKEIFNARLHTLGAAVEKLLQEHRPDAIAIETLFFNKNVKTAIGVAQVRGMIIYLALAHNCLVYEYGPQEIKVAVTGYGKSDKRGVIDMVKRLAVGVPDIVEIILRNDTF